MAIEKRSRTAEPGRGWVRSEAVAGMFYPRDPQELWAQLQELEGQARLPHAPELPQAIIAPHAGYVYSGPVAASAYAWLRAGRGRVKCVGILGPSHRASFSGLAASSAAGFATPLGVVSIDEGAVRRLKGLGFVHALDVVHEHEHALEVQLPFLMWALDYKQHPFTIVPLLTGDVPSRDVGRVIEQLWDEQALVVVSSDLSHYHEYEAARQMDRAASQAIERLAPQQLAPTQACGQVAIQGLLHAAAARGLRAMTVDLRNSGDTAGPRDQVVGYGAYVFLR